MENLVPCPDGSYVSKKADISPGTQPCGHAEEDIFYPPGRVITPLDQLYEQLQALTKRVEKLEAGEFGK